MSRRLGWSTLIASVLALGAAGTSAFAQTPPPADAPPPAEAPAVTAAPAAAPPAEAPPPAPMAPPPEAAPAPKPAAPTAPSMKLEAPNGLGSIKVGLLLQPQFQALNPANKDGYQLNLFIRRTRLLFGGALFGGTIEYFIDTDFPNLFLGTDTTTVTGTAAAMDQMATATSPKATPGMNIQDAFATWKIAKDLVKVDVGYMLPPLAHNAVQGATTLLSWDYFTYTFQSTNSFGATAGPVGRDLGVQLRGLVLDGHIEYRLGLFQGLRQSQGPVMGTTDPNISGQNFFRATGRVQVNLLDPETGFFYAGTYLGAKKVLSIGASFDVQKSYKYFAGDVFADLPLGGGNVLTAQVNVAHWDGGTFIPGLVKQTAIMGEAGFLIGAAKISPIIRVEELLIKNAAMADANQTRIGPGIALWPFGHNSNLKAFYSHTTVQGEPHAASQYNVQWQLYFY